MSTADHPYWDPERVERQAETYRQAGLPPEKIEEVLEDHGKTWPRSIWGCPTCKRFLRGDRETGLRCPSTHGVIEVPVMLMVELVPSKGAK